MSCCWHRERSAVNQREEAFSALAMTFGPLGLSIQFIFTPAITNSLRRVPFCSGKSNNTARGDFMRQTFTWLFIVKYIRRSLYAVAMIARCIRRRLIGESLFFAFFIRQLSHSHLRLSRASEKGTCGKVKLAFHGSLWGNRFASFGLKWHVTIAN